MKTLQLQTEKATILLVDFITDFLDPDEKISSIVAMKHGMISVYGNNKWITDIKIPEGFDTVLGSLDSLSEEQKGRVVESHGDVPIWFKDYRSGSLFGFYDLEHPLSAAIDGFQSLLESYNVTRVNPIGKKEPNIINYTISEAYFKIRKEREVFYSPLSFEDVYNTWQSAEALTFNNPLVLIEHKK